MKIKFQLAFKISYVRKINSVLAFKRLIIKILFGIRKFKLKVLLTKRFTIEMFF